MNGGLIAIPIIVGTLALAGLITWLSVRAYRRMIARQTQALVDEGIVLDSGQVMMTFRFENFRGPRAYIGVGVRAGNGRCVLTRRRFTFVPVTNNAYGIAVMDRAGIARFQIDVQEGRLHLRSDNPPNASGTVDVLISVADPAAWVAALSSFVRGS